jgi:NitT/TauT family transport system ATP-binding protein
VRGRPLAGPPKGIGMVFQRDVLLDWRTILQNVLITAEFQGRPTADVIDRARALLERFGLGAFQDRHPWELSGGMRQRASICRALLCEPEILLMDELGALDDDPRRPQRRADAHLQAARRTVICHPLDRRGGLPVGPWR